MSLHPLNEQYLYMHREIALGDRALIAIAGHVEVRSVLRASSALLAHDLADVLIGSYARRVSIWPGKDVDVFGRLMADSTSTLGADDAYRLFEDALARYADEDRLTQQPRSLKVAFDGLRV